MTKPKSATSPPVLILYGLDTDGRPRAAVFNAAQADLATKAAESLELQVLRIETVEQIELARQLPSGEILAPGRGNVPVVRKELFDKLLALVPTPDSGPSQAAASAAEVDAVPSATTTDNSGPASKAPRRSSHRPLGPKLMSAIWCSPKTGTPKPAGSKPWSSNRSATTSSSLDSGIIPKKEPWFAAAISWRCWRQPDRQCPSAQKPPRPSTATWRPVAPSDPARCPPILCNPQFDQSVVLGGGGGRTLRRHQWRSPC